MRCQHDVVLCSMIWCILIAWESELGGEETHSAGIGQKVRAHGLDVAVVGETELAHGLEVLLAGPAARQDGQWQCNLDGGHDAVEGGGGSRWGRTAAEGKKTMRGTR